MSAADEREHLKSEELQGAAVHAFPLSLGSSNIGEKTMRRWFVATCARWKVQGANDANRNATGGLALISPPQDRLKDNAVRRGDEPVTVPPRVPGASPYRAPPEGDRRTWAAANKRKIGKVTSLVGRGSDEQEQMRATKELLASCELQRTPKVTTLPLPPVKLAAAAGCARTKGRNTSLRAAADCTRQDDAGRELDAAARLALHRKNMEHERGWQGWNELEQSRLVGHT